MGRKYRQSRESGYTILLVDDDPDYAEAMQSLLEGEGHRVLVEGSGAAALATARECHVDLMLLDYFMPQSTGEQELKGHEPVGWHGGFAKGVGHL